MPKSTKDRRRLLQGIAIGGGLYSGSKLLPETWTKPVIESSVLPVHAQTSPDPEPDDDDDDDDRDPPKKAQ